MLVDYAPVEVAFVENESGRGTRTLRIRARVANGKGAVIPGNVRHGHALTLGEQKNTLIVREEAIDAD